MVPTNRTHASLLGHTVGHYRVEALIGRGAMASVYLAHDDALHRPVAVKVLLGSLARNPDQVRQFHREAKAAGVLQHPNIVGIYEAGLWEGTPFIAMEYVEGEPLDRFLRRSGRLPWRNALHIIAQIASALDCAHRAGIIHCDVKPSNILIGGDGTLRLADFGIARASQSAGSAQTDFVGSPAWMSPEQCNGAVRLTPATDLFSLGALLYQLLSARLPFEADTVMGLLNAICHETPKPLREICPQVPDDVLRLASHLMEKAPLMRPLSAKQVCERIQRILREDGGLSALPEALDAFIRDLSEPRALSLQLATPKPATAPPKPVCMEGTGQHTAPTTRCRHRVIAVTALAGIALLAGIAWERYTGPAVGGPPPAPVVAAMEIHHEGNWQWTALPSPDWRVARLCWVGNRPVLLAGVEGRPGTALEGCSGILAYDVEAQRVLSTHAPQGPYFDPALSGVPLNFPSIPALPESAPFHDALLCVHRLPGETPCYAYRAHAWNAAMESGPELFRLETNSEHPPEVTLHPDGRHACIVLTDGSGAGEYLELRGIAPEARTIAPVRITDPGLPIVAGSLAYSRDGRWLTFMRATADQQRAVYLIPAEGRSVAPEPVLTGNLYQAAFSPEGDTLSIVFKNNNKDSFLNFSIFIYRFSNIITKEETQGTANTKAAWMPVRNDLYRFASPFGAIDPHREPLESSLLEHNQVVTASPDGHWIAAAIETAAGVRVIIGPLEENRDAV